MKNSNNAKTIASVQNHMARQVGGKKALFEEMQQAKKRNGSLRMGIDELVDGGIFLIYNGDVYNFLHRLGYTKAQLDKMDSGKRWDLYRHLLIRDGERFYRDYERAKAVKKTAKR